MLYISIIILFLFTLFATYLTRKYESNSIIKLVSPAVVAVIVFGGNELISLIGFKLNKPALSIKTVVKETEVHFTLKIESGKVSTLSIDYPVYGVIKKILSRNSITTGKESVMRASGRPEGESQNNAELLIENIESNEPLQYDIVYSPLPKGIFIAGIDKYKIVYTWKYKGNEYSETEWRLVDSDRITDKPTLMASEVEIYHRALTPEEIRQIYEREKKQFSR